MIYSRWRPEGGGYDYFRDDSVHNLNDDLPTPELGPRTKIGVASIQAGRPLPPDAVPAGSGRAARGVIVPVDERRIVRRTRSLSGLDEATPGGMLIVAAGVGLALYLAFSHH